MKLLPYFLIGSAFGFVLTEAEAVSWFRIQEMFRFESFHMYGIILSAVLTAAASIAVIRRLGLKDADGGPLGIAPKNVGRGVRYAAGGTIFGIGWALTGACPGPLAALFGYGVTVAFAAFLSALVGAWTYGALRTRLPH